MKQPKTKIVCHRGACLSAPENTFASGEAALALGGSVIELDIRQSADGVLYVLHDATVDRTTDGRGAIVEMESAEIDRLDAGGWFGPAFAGQRVPRLEPFLAHFPEAGFYLEVKRADCRAIAETVSRLGIAARCFTFSFDAEMRRGMWEAAPEVRRMIHWSTAGSAEAAREEHGAAIVEFHAHDFDAAHIRACQNAGLEVMFFSDKPDERLFREALALEMDYVNIDFISEFAALRSAFGGAV